MHWRDSDADALLLEGSSKGLVGAGSTFVAPLVQQWEADYVKTDLHLVQSKSRV